MPTVENGYQVDLPKRKNYRRNNYMTKRKLPRKEEDCIKHVRNFLNREKDRYKSEFKIAKDKEEYFIPEIGKCVISDAVIYSSYRVKPDSKKPNARWTKRMRRVISIEFEEHWQKYSILNDVHRCPAIHVPLRKLHYYRPFNAQYWIKIDVDGTPICIPYKYIAGNSECINDIGVHGQFTSKHQTNMIKAASRDENGEFPSYVLTGWRTIFKEFRRILTAYDEKKEINLII
jgi:hypothetical protein